MVLKYLFINTYAYLHSYSSKFAAGTYSAWKANAIGGRNEKAVNEYLEKNWTTDMEEVDAVQLTVKALLEVVDSGAKNMEIAIMRPGSTVATVPEDELQSIIEAIEKEQEEIKSKTANDPNLVGGI